MAHATGLRLLAVVCMLTVIGIPFGILFWLMARKKEKERERELAALEKMAEKGESG